MVRTRRFLAERRSLAAVLATTLLLLFSGCLSPRSPTSPTAVDTPFDPLAADLKGIEGDKFSIQVPVDVILVGFSPDVGPALQSHLQSRPVNQRGVFVPTANYRVHQTSEGFVHEALDFIRSTRLDVTQNSDVDIYDANLAEGWLYSHLAKIGLSVANDTPTLVLLHGGDTLGANHAYRYTYPNGWLQPVRVFGERFPLLVLDVSARPDPYSASSSDSFDVVIPAQGEATINALRDAALAATDYRLLQGPVYPVPVKRCHAVTLVYAIRATATSEVAPGQRAAETYVDVDQLDAAFENLTGLGTVTVDLKTLRLPFDDPDLEVISRTGDHGSIRAWIVSNWQRYWVPHEGCEAYVSFLLYGDMADTTFLGLAMYDVDDDRRISISFDPEYERFFSSVGAVAPLPQSRTLPNYVAQLFAHETGHLFGQRHPHDISSRTDWETDRSFSSVWSCMSYQTNDRVIDFGKIDRANFMRNRLGFLLQAARADGLEPSPAYATAIQNLERYDWEAAAEALFATMPSAQKVA